jgi:hypothetical protein
MGLIQNFAIIEFPIILTENKTVFAMWLGPENVTTFTQNSFAIPANSRRYFDFIPYRSGEREITINNSNVDLYLNGVLQKGQSAEFVATLESKTSITIVNNSQVEQKGFFVIDHVETVGEITMAGRDSNLIKVNFETGGFKKLSTNNPDVEIRQVFILQNGQLVDASGWHSSSTLGLFIQAGAKYISLTNRSDYEQTIKLTVSDVETVEMGLNEIETAPNTGQMYFRFVVPETDHYEFRYQTVGALSFAVFDENFNVIRGVNGSGVAKSTLKQGQVVYIRFMPFQSKLGDISLEITTYQQLAFWKIDGEKFIGQNVTLEKNRIYTLEFWQDSDTRITQLEVNLPFDYENYLTINYATGEILIKENPPSIISIFARTFGLFYTYGLFITVLP